jgi:chorismate mutase-like protein
MDLGPIRDQIDGLDREIVQLLNRRLTLAAEIGKLKRSAGGQIYVAEREDAVLRKVTELNKGPIKNEALQAIYREVMSAAIALEKPPISGRKPATRTRRRRRNLARAWPITPWPPSAIFLRRSRKGRPITR